MSEIIEEALQEYLKNLNLQDRWKEHFHN